MIDFIHPDDKERVENSLSGLQSECKTDIEPYRFLDAKGHWRWIETTITNQLENPSVNALITNSRDITDVKSDQLNQVLLNEIRDIFRQDLSMELMFSKITKRIADFVHLELSEVWIANTQRNQFYRLATEAKNRTTILKQNRYPSDKGLLSDVAKQSEVAFVSTKEFKQVMAIPFVFQKDVLGVLLLASKTEEPASVPKREMLEELVDLLGSKLKYRQQRDEFNYLFQSAPDLLCLIDKHGRFLKVNPAFCHLLGYTSEELMACNFNEFIHPEDRDKTNQEFNVTITGSREAEEFVNRYISKKGEVYWISWSSSKVFGNDGLAFGYGRNITERKKLEILWNKTCNLARIGSWEVSIRKPDDFDVYWSEMTRELMGVDDAYDQSLTGGFEMFDSDSGAVLVESFNRLLNEGKDFDVEVLVRRNDRSTFWARCIGDAEIMDDLGARVYGSIQDIDRRKQMGIELGRKTKYLHSLTSVISAFLKHEDWFSVIDQCFDIVGNTIEVDRVYYFENHVDVLNGKELCSQRFEWSSSGKLSQVDNPLLQNIPVERFAPFFEPLQAGHPFNAIVSEVQDTVLRTNLEEQKIKSILVLPIFVDDLFYGFIGFDDCTDERVWSPDDINYLAIFTSNLSAAVQRRNHQQQLELALSERNVILESIQDGFYAIDHNWNVTYWNRMAEEILAISKDEIVGKRIWEVYPEFSLGKSMQYCKHVFASGEMAFFEETLSGTDRWFELNIYPARNGLSVYFKEITRRKLAERQLQISNERFMKVTEATNDAIWDWDIVHAKLFRGEGFRTLFGYEPSSMAHVDQAIRTFVHSKDRSRVQKSLKKAMRNPKVTAWTEQYRYIRSDGTYAYVTDRSIIIRDGNGQPIRIVGAVMDITERHNYEDSLRKLNEDLETRARQLAVSNAELEQFAYVASHDLQEPLRMISSFMGLLQKKYNSVLDQTALKYIHFATDGALRMRQIILDLLEYSRVGQETDDLEELDLMSIINDVLFMNKAVIEKKRAQIEVGKMPRISGYKILMTQIFQNLISNALKYSRENTTPLVRINCRRDKGYWLFTVEDNGIGIEKEYFEQIFNVFKRLWDQSDYPGTGMGLAIVKKVLDGLGGEIWLESVPGEGTTFFFRIK